MDNRHELLDTWIALFYIFPESPAWTGQSLLYISQFTELTNVIVLLKQTLLYDQ